MSKKLHSVVALFKTPDEIMHAAEKTRDAGYKDFDVHTPYPVHGMDHAMGLPGTKLPYVTLAFGLFGLAFSLFFQWYVSGNPNAGFGAKNLLLPVWLERYPFVIGGKPLFSLPAFVPVMFELTILLAALSTVAFLIAVFCNLPNNSHALHDTDYMKAVSCDHYGLCIESSDDQFDEAKIRAFFEELGGTSIVAIKEPYRRPPSFFSTLIFLGVLVAVAGGVSTKAYLIYNKLLYIAPFTWMEEQPKLDPQEYNAVFQDGRSMQAPVEGTVARGHMPYLYKGNPQGANQNLVNPLPLTAANLARGKVMYRVYCGVCHGEFGDGDGTVPSREAGQPMKPPSLHSGKLKRDWGDGRIYHVIMEGQNVMPSYAKQVSESDRWAIVHYVRALQRAKDAKESDLE